MTLYLRLALILLFSRFKPLRSPFEPTLTKFRVWPADLDFLGHMTNSRYFTVMDAGRTDMIARAGLLGKLHKNGWYPVVVEESMQFRRSLNPFERFELKTQITGYDDRHMVIRQTFLRGDEVVALGVVRARFLGPNGRRVTPQEVMALADVDGEVPPAISFAEEEQLSYQYHRQLIEEEAANLVAS